MRFLTICLILGCLFGSLVAFVFGQEPEQPTRAVPQDQCVRILVEDRDGNYSLGSGALISDKFVATANHVVKDRATDKVTVNFPNQSIVGDVLGGDPNLDISIIMLAEVPKCKPLEVADAHGALSVQGYGSGKYKQQWGVLSTTTTIRGWYKVEGVEARSGDSGGPVIDVNGAFVGTLWGSVDGDTYFTPADKVLRHLERIKALYGIIDIKLAARYHTRGRVERFFKRSTPELLGGRYHSRKRVEKFFKRSTRKAVA
jgi:S1-C subfamily serine protease